MSPQDFRRMVLAWELIPQSAASPDDQEAPLAPNDAGPAPAEQSGSPAITSAIRGERLRDA